MAREECGNCRFYQDEHASGWRSGYGKCLRGHPPVPTNDGKHCGDWEAEQMNIFADHEVTPTPFGDGKIAKTDKGWRVDFSGPMAREALEWALSASEEDRRGYGKVLDLVDPRN